MYPTISSQTYQTGGQLSIDLHGSSVKEAKTSLQETFNTAEEQGLSQVTLITGLGKHSKNNYSVLFNKTVPEFLEQPEIKARISQVKLDHRGAYEVVFKNEEQLEKIEMLKKSWGPFAFPAKDFERVKQKAEKGSADDQFNLSIRYLQGYGTEINVEEAEHWMISAANNGHHYANTQLGLMYDLGYGVKQNYRKALKWHEKGAKQNEPYSLLILGCYYWLGKIVVRDDLKAVGYLSRAAKLNEHSAGCNLGVILLRGTETVASDPLQAKELFKSAAKASFVWGQVLLAKQYFFGWGIPQNNLKAHKWFLIASGQNDLIAQYYLGRMYNEGRGVPIDHKLAFKWFQKSAAQGDKDAKTAVARFLIEGISVPQNIQQGIADLEDLAEKGHPQSAGILGCYYLGGIKEKLEKNVPLAIKYLSQAAEGGNVSSLKLLASLHFKGEIEGADPKIGESFLRKASKKKDPEAHFMLAMQLLKRRGTERSEIVQLLEQSAEQNYGPAEYFLGLFYLDGGLVEVDESRGLPLLIRAAKQGIAMAQFTLGEYLITKESEKEKLQAVGYFVSAAKRGHAEAMICLACCYRDGIGLVPNQKSYLKWLNKAEVAGASYAFYEKGRLCQLENRDSEAFHYFLKAAQKGCLEGKKNLFKCYLKGYGTQPNVAEGLKWLKEVFEEEPTPFAEHLLGCIYADPTKGHYNLKEAIHWLSLAIIHGHEQSVGNLKELYKYPKAQKAVFQALTECAQNSPLSLLCVIQLSLKKDLEIEESLLQKVMESNDPYLQFITIPQFLKLNRPSEAKMLLDRCSQEAYKKTKEDPNFAYQIGNFYSYINETTSAMNWFSKASDKNHRKATIELSRLLFRKTETDPTFYKKAFEKGLEAANFGDSLIQYTIACIYTEGMWGIEQNHQEAARWARKAAESGDADAQILLDMLQAI
ncbi:MAG: SEL1-like repeat protein [Parachlamydiaceae bacterium]